MRGFAPTQTNSLLYKAADLKNAARHLLLNSLSLILLAISLSVAILCGACARTNNEPTPPASTLPATTYPMPPLSAYAQMGWIDANNQRSRLLDYRGKVLVLDFYATWCEPCRQSIPRLNGLQEQYGPERVQVVGLNVGGPDDRIKVPEFAQELNIRYPLGFPDKVLTDFFLSDDQTIPQTFVFARDGALAKRFVGYDATTGADLETVIQTELSKK
ncbi:MAG: TlpA family protein disulfide reductase [Blastocatellia bacterium]|nr:TlpA family protein disulfide reductase [Blastocatellia bacterium]